MDNCFITIKIPKEIVIWCNECEKATKHLFGDIGTFFTCSQCNHKKTLRLLNNDGTFDRFFLFAISEKASLLKNLRNEKDQWISIYSENKEGYISKMLDNMISGLSKSLLDKKVF